MASIGGISCKAFTGRMTTAQRTVRIANNFLSNGSAIVIGGYRSRPATIRTTHTQNAFASLQLTTTAMCATLIDSILATNATLVTVVDQFGQTWSRVGVVDVQASHSLTANGEYVVLATWELLPETMQTGVAP